MLGLALRFASDVLWLVSKLASVQVRLEVAGVQVGFTRTIKNLHMSRLVRSIRGIPVKVRSRGGKNREDRRSSNEEEGDKLDLDHIDTEDSFWHTHGNSQNTRPTQARSYFPCSTVSLWRNKFDTDSDPRR